MSESTPGLSEHQDVQGVGPLREGPTFSFPALSTPGQAVGLPLRPLAPQKSAMKGHQRSASHGGVATRPATATGSPSISAGSAGLVSRPSALKSPPGHQRAFSQGQITEDAGSGGLTRSGHSRVGSRTDFILPPGHREGPSGMGSGPGSAGSLFRPGHKRQASRTESIYTLRMNRKPSFFIRLLNTLLRRKMISDTDTRLRTVVPNHLVPSNSGAAHPNARYANNYVCTTKYTLLSFLPKNLFEQFHRMANLYFILIILLNWFPEINAFGKEISMIPVIFVLGVTAVKDLFEDRRRHTSDNRINNSTCRIYDGLNGRYKKVRWKQVRVGDIIHLSNNELIPADILLLRSSDPHGLCYVDSCNLDGESNLKTRTVVPGFKDKQSMFQPHKFESLMEVDAPTTKIYQFHGSLVHPSGERVPVSNDNLLLRECVVKNTDYVEGIVVYAGHETKALLNNGGPRYKRTAVERQMNRDIIWCVVILLVLCTVGAVGCRMWLSSYQLPVPFIPFAKDPDYEGFLTFWTFVIILQVMIPLSLYVTVEVTKLLQVYNIHHDPGLYDQELKKGVECRALNTIEELGQVQFLFSDKTGTLTENKMAFRRVTVGGVDYNHPPPPNEQRLNTRPGVPVPILLNSKLQEDISYIQRAKPLSSEGPDIAGRYRQAQRLQELLLVLALCNTVVVSKRPHRDQMNASGMIEPVTGLLSPKREAAAPTFPTPSPVKPTPPRPLIKKLSSPVVHSTEKVAVTSRSNSDLCLRTVRSDPDSYARLCESRSVTPSPPPPPLPSTLSEPSSSPARDRPRLLNVPSLLFIGKKNKGNQGKGSSTTPSPCELKPIFEAESPDELALVDAAHSYDCRLLTRNPTSATIALPGEGILEFEILKTLPFDSTRKMMSVVVRHPVTKQIVMLSKGADSSILSNLTMTESLDAQQTIFRTQQHLNSYGRQGLRVLVMAKRVLSEAEFARWLAHHREIEVANEAREQRTMESYCALETNLTLIGATGIEDRLQDGVPECIAQLISAGIVVWVLTGDKQETAINVAYSAKLFAPHMEILRVFGRSKAAVENAIKFHLSDINSRSPQHSDVRLDRSGVFGRGMINSPTGPGRTSKKRALVIDGKSLTYILDPRSQLQRPFLELTQLCSSVLCCRATPLQKSRIVNMVKVILHKRTLAVGDGANDVSMIQAADIGVGISGQEGMQAIMASDYALPRFKYLERFILVHGHWCYDRLARMVLYFFYKNATFVFLIFWYQLYCGYSGEVMIDQMYLMLYNLFFTSLPPLAIGVYDRDASEELLLASPALYRQGRLGTVYQPASFWIVMADSVYQSIVIFFIALGAYYNSDIGLWEFGTTITTACMFIMLVQVAIETKSWTIIHVLSIIVSIFTFFAFSLLYNGLCDDCFGLPINYWVMQTLIVTPVFWLLQLLTAVLALLPRFLWICYARWLSPNEVMRAVRDRRSRLARGEDFLASWSRSTSTSSIYRNMDMSLKTSVPPNLASVG